MKQVLSVVQGFLYLCTLVVAYEYYGDLGGVEVPKSIYHLLLIAILGVSVVIAIGHVIGGGLMGLTSGGVLGGMRMGFILGAGVGLSRLWPYCIIVGAVALLNQASAWHWIISFLLAVIFFALHLMVRHLWKSA